MAITLKIDDSQKLPCGSRGVDLVGRPGNRGAGYPNAGWTSGDRTDVLTVLLPSVDLAIAKVAPAEVKTGETFTYTITVSNNGPDDGTGVEVVDTLPVGVTFVSASTPKFSDLTFTKNFLT